ncbi:hypothetical protein SBOR_7479 [Sclerotinia borealis F-4128]|uniref:Uncharacterized protein n=1 Tax=Sclerotinia borealis (strain F-4128) TaxID=1432307 RepID=W9C5U5_SCLBF|nr:hypothetical protein SBOR_7479 [Sclerotinia borealis F-4128]
MEKVHEKHQKRHTFMESLGENTQDSFFELKAARSSPGYTQIGLVKRTLAGVANDNLRSILLLAAIKVEAIHIPGIDNELADALSISKHELIANWCPHCGINAKATETGEEKKAHTHVFTDLNELEKGEWDFAFFRREKLRNWADESEERVCWTIEVDANVVKGVESEIGIVEILDQKDSTGERGDKTAMGNELKELTDNNREEKCISDEKEKIAKEKVLKY